MDSRDRDDRGQDQSGPQPPVYRHAPEDPTEQFGVPGGGQQQYEQPYSQQQYEQQYGTQQFGAPGAAQQFGQPAYDQQQYGQQQFGQQQFGQPAYDQQQYGQQQYGQPAYDQQSAPPKKRSTSAVWIWVIGGLIVAILILFFVLWLGSRGDGDGSSTPAATSTVRATSTEETTSEGFPTLPDIELPTDIELPSDIQVPDNLDDLGTDLENQIDDFLNNLDQQFNN
ncbi:hypothetical protein [Corynebacterium terpenotabidum]|uniref:hypothetical protein n=1 Tax=Corynebacterium terpenotabidum TaxID=89154 RepID=UPI0012ED9B9B|nr:hypothetical protein [Corynebacterium terpenotabidum]